MISLRQLYVISFVLTSLLVPSWPAIASDAPVGDASKSSQQSKLENGLYLVTREGPASQKITPSNENEQLEVYDYRLMNPSDKEEPVYVVLQKNPFIPIRLGSSPDKAKDDEGKPKLMLQLTDDQIVPLEQFTRENCGKTIAIVIGGQIVSKHKIRTVVEGGKVQITRCTDNGCDKIYSELVEDMRRKKQEH